MKSLILVLIAASAVVGIKNNSVGFLEAAATEENEPDLDWYLDDPLDMMWVLLTNAHGDTQKRDEAFVALSECDSFDAYEALFDTISTECVTRDSSINFIRNLIDDLVRLTNECGEPNYASELTNSKDRYLNLVATEYAEMLTTGTATEITEDTKGFPSFMLIAQDDPALSITITIDGDGVEIEGCDGESTKEDEQEQENEEEAQEEQAQEEVVEEVEEEMVEAEAEAEEEVVEEEVEDEEEEIVEEIDREEQYIPQPAEIVDAVESVCENP